MTSTNDPTNYIASLVSNNGPTFQWTSEEEKQAYLRARQETRIPQHFGTSPIDESEESYDFDSLAEISLDDNDDEK